MGEGRQNLTENWMDLKTVSKEPQRILVNLQLLFESVLLAIFVTNNVHILGGSTMCPEVQKVLEPGNQVPRK